jgi:hypothetical protein
MEAVLSHEAFGQSLNTKFATSTDEGEPVELELVEVSELKTFPGQESFAVVFRGPNEATLGQGMRAFEHSRMGQFELFIVPFKQDAAGLYYEAIFNRFPE